MKKCDSLHDCFRTVEVDFGNVGEVSEALLGDFLGAVEVSEEVEDLPEEDDEVHAVGVGGGLEHFDQEVRRHEVREELRVPGAEGPGKGKKTHSTEKGSDN